MNDLTIDIPVISWITWSNLLPYAVHIKNLIFYEIKSSKGKSKRFVVLEGKKIAYS